jgi:hypothetical protein
MQRYVKLDLICFFLQINLAQVGRSVTLTSGCVIGAKCSLTTNETLPENTVIFGTDHQRRTMPDRPAVRVIFIIIHKMIKKFSSSFKLINSIFLHVFYQHHIMFLNMEQKVTHQHLHRILFVFYLVLQIFISLVSVQKIILPFFMVQITLYWVWDLSS